MWICGRVLRTGASPAGRVDKPVDNADALPTASPTLSRLSPTSSTGPTTSDSKRLPLTALRFNICVPLNPIPTSPTRWLTLSRSGSFPYGIRLSRHTGLSDPSGACRLARIETTITSSSSVPLRPKTRLSRSGTANGLDESTRIVKTGPDLGFAGATDFGDAGRFAAWMRGACSAIRGVSTMLDLITTQAKHNLSSRSGIGGVLSAT